MEREQYHSQEAQLTTISQKTHQRTEAMEQRDKKPNWFSSLCIIILREIIMELEAMLARLEEETGEQHDTEHGWFYYVSDSFAGVSTNKLEKALAKLQFQEGLIDRRKMFSDPYYLFHILQLQREKRRIETELLMRKNPEARELRDALRVIGERKHKAHRAWEKEILAREGEEGLKRRNQNGEGPRDQYTHEELDMRVRLTQLKVEAGILPPTALKHELEEREAGGYYKWEKEFFRKNAEANIRELVASNYPETARVIGNIQRLNEWRYGKEYAEQQHIFLTDLANNFSQKEAPAPLDTLPA